MMQGSSFSTAALSSSTWYHRRPTRFVSSSRKRPFHQIMFLKHWARWVSATTKKRPRQCSRRPKQSLPRNDEAAQDLKTLAFQKRSCYDSNRNCLKRRARSRPNWSSSSGCRCSRCCSSNSNLQRSSFSSNNKSCSSSSSSNKQHPTQLMQMVALQPVPAQRRHRQMLLRSRREGSRSHQRGCRLWETFPYHRFQRRVMMKMTIIPKALRVCACEAERGVCWEFVWCDKSEMMITVCAVDQDMSVCVGGWGGWWSVSARSWSVKEDCSVCVCGGGVL